MQGDQQMQFDFIYQPLNDFQCIESGSIATFIEFGVNKKWNDIDVSTIVQCISKGKQLSTIFKCLKYAKYCLPGGRITEEPSSNDLIERVTVFCYTIIFYDLNSGVYSKNGIFSNALY